MHMNGVYVATHCNTNDEEEERGRSNDNETDNYNVYVIYINTVVFRSPVICQPYAFDRTSVFDFTLFSVWNLFDRCTHLPLSINGTFVKDPDNIEALAFLHQEYHLNALFQHTERRRPMVPWHLGD